MVVPIISKEELDNIMVKLKVVQNVPLEEVPGLPIASSLVSKITLKHYKLNEGLRELKDVRDQQGFLDLKVGSKD